MVEFLSIIGNNEIAVSILTGAIALTASLLSTAIVYRTKSRIDLLTMTNDEAEVSKALQKIEFSFKDLDVSTENKKTDKNVLGMMTDNVSELREYYVISKQQARKSFSAALFICFFGILIYLIGIGAHIFGGKDISLISIIGGTVVEIIAGLFFWLYREATKQLGVYHQRLGSTEKYLTVIQIIKEMPEDKQVDAYNGLITSILSDNREIILHEK